LDTLDSGGGERPGLKGSTLYQNGVRLVPDGLGLRVAVSGLGNLLSDRVLGALLFEKQNKDEITIWKKEHTICSRHRRQLTGGAETR
jgi:hypothetical protein